MRVQGVSCFVFCKIRILCVLLDYHEKDSDCVVNTA